MIRIQKDRRLSRKKSVSIDMAPLIDMVFILLIFFIVTSTFSPETSVAIDRPESNVVSVVPSKCLMIMIDRSEKITIEDTPMNLLQVESQVRQLAQQDKDKKVLVLADKKVSIETVLKTLDACRRAGVEASVAAKGSE
jgi:biopolymer transport protein ExbD